VTVDAVKRRPEWVDWIVGAATENIGLKLASLLIALALFGMVRGAGNVQRSMEVSLLARLPASTAGRVLLTDLPERVRVTVRGAPSVVGGLRSDDLGPVQVDLSDGRSPSVILDSRLFQVPGGVQIVTIQPSSLQLTWDAIVDRDIPIRADLTGTPETGTHLTNPPDIIPPRVHVSGPGLYVDPLGAVRTDPIDITGLASGHYERRVALVSPRPHVRYDQAGGVRVVFDIERQIIERRFDRVTITPVGGGRVELRPSLATVIVRGEPGVVNALDAAQLIPTVEIGDAALLRTGTRMPLHVGELPAGVTLVSAEPTDVIVLPTR
jgi:hypothetical protein